MLPKAACLAYAGQQADAAPALTCSCTAWREQANVSIPCSQAGCPSQLMACGNQAVLVTVTYKAYVTKMTKLLLASIQQRAHAVDGTSWTRSGSA